MSVHVSRKLCASKKTLWRGPCNSVSKFKSGVFLWYCIFTLPFKFAFAFMFSLQASSKYYTFNNTWNCLFWVWLWHRDIHFYNVCYTCFVNILRYWTTCVTGHFGHIHYPSAIILEQNRFQNIRLKCHPLILFSNYRPVDSSKTECYLLLPLAISSILCFSLKVIQQLLTYSSSSFRQFYPSLYLSFFNVF